MARGKISRLERLRRRDRIAVHQGRAFNTGDDLLSNGIDWHIVFALLRLCQCGRTDLDKGGREELDRILESTCGFRTFSKRH